MWYYMQMVETRRFTSVPGECRIYGCPHCLCIIKSLTYLALKTSCMQTLSEACVFVRLDEVFCGLNGLEMDLLKNGTVFVGTLMF